MRVDRGKPEPGGADGIIRVIDQRVPAAALADQPGQLAQLAVENGGRLRAVLSSQPLARGENNINRLRVL